MGNRTSCPIEHMPTDPEPFLANGNLNFTAHSVGWIIAGFFGLIGSVASFWLIKKHLEFYTKPTQQKYIVRILLMVPCYATYSWLSYYFWRHALYFELIRDCYESIVIASFFTLLLFYLGDNEEEHARVFKQVQFKTWIWPLGRWRYKPSGPYFLVIMKWCIGQYWVFRPGCTLVAVVTQALNLYCLASWSPMYSHVYTSVLISISVTIAMFAVLQFYVTMKEELKDHSPMMKFFAVKLVVFLTFWESSLLSALTMFGVIKPTAYWSAAEIEIGISAILTCFEMAIFGFLHIRCFTYLPYRPVSSDPAKRAFQKTSKRKAFLDVIDLRDVFRDLWIGTKQVARKCVGKELDKPEPESHMEQVFGRSRIYDQTARMDNVSKKANLSKTDIEKELERIKLEGTNEEEEKLLDGPGMRGGGDMKVSLEMSVPWANTATAFSPEMHSPHLREPQRDLWQTEGMSFGDARKFPKSSTGVLFPLPSPMLDYEHQRIRSPIQSQEGEIDHSRPSGWFRKVMRRVSGSRHTPIPTEEANQTGDILHDRILPYYHPAPVRPAQPQPRRSSGPTPPRNGLRMPNPLSPSRYPGFNEQEHVDRMYALHAVAESVTASPRNSGSSFITGSNRSSFSSGQRVTQAQPRPARRISAPFVQPPMVISPPPNEFGTNSIVLPRHNLPATSVYSMAPSSSNGTSRSSRGQREVVNAGRRLSHAASPQATPTLGIGRRYSADQPTGLGLSFSPGPPQTHETPRPPQPYERQGQQQQQQFVFDEY